MTFDLFMVWSNLCSNCCRNTGKLLRSICKYAGERIVVHGPFVSYFFFSENRLWHFMQIVSNGDCLHEISNSVFGKKLEKYKYYIPERVRE